MPPLPLPRVQGPKLAPFNGTATAEINFIQSIGGEADKDSTVWEVQIDEKRYALKMFHFTSWSFCRNLSSTCYSLADDQSYTDYFDPFNCECRAYGRLKEEGREDLAVKAYGYLLLTPSQEHTINDKILSRLEKQPILDKDGSERWVEVCTQGTHAEDTETDGTAPPWYRFPQHAGQPVRAIVKELAYGPAFTAAQAEQMYQDLESLHALGIFVNDIHWGNYKHGKLIDFSRAYTMFHPSLDRPSEVMLYKTRSLEGCNLGVVFEEWNEEAAWGEHGGVKVVMPEGLRQYFYDGFGVEPGEYDWRKWGDDDGFDPDALYWNPEGAQTAVDGDAESVDGENTGKDEELDEDADLDKRT